MMKKLLSAVALTVALAVPSVAATVSGNFNVKVVNQTNLNSAQSEATMENFNTYYGAGTNGVNRDVFTYIGDLFFGNSAATIAAWLDTGPGTVGDLDPIVGAKELSKGFIGENTATTSFFLFERVGYFSPGDLSIIHDDGIAVFDDGLRIGGNNGPTSQTTTAVNGFTGGKFSILYVATNGNPSILKASFTPSPVPVPAAGFLLIGALGGLVALRRRKTA